MRRPLRFLRACSPVRVLRVPRGDGALGVELLVLRWHCRVVLRATGVFGNGSSWWSGWHDWRPEAAEYGPCYDLCCCRACWRGWTGVSFRQRLRWRLGYMWQHGC